ncbi:hypothetical protein TWF173_002390 [Orbilia oligospora]|uniref:Uncharacterized protein n=2 Tax=Orbilia oligospora TaxID=2813651 RepID=G1XJK7_ARTOA|nr:hypothetical protein AOL_s00097g534 [Orbilia oligospora ATCC 24927]EGX46630.1 hypothetical protein AOL_s00097g534 [Orbilia oligospora ATCC 24927]KAF3288328.1 hypothetical protein TWF970_005408 [Orbilia oligospora]KAF3307738.1 hypothetical protein TWF173_002390 [Orbilia oligospora]
MPLVTNLQNPLTKSTASETPERKGGESPPPERQSSKQLGASSSGQTSTTDQRAENQETLRRLPSNPIAPMDPTADLKTRKPSKMLDGL